MAEWAIERLAGQHDRAAFDCGVASLSGWIREYAGQHETRDLARVYALVRPGQSRVFGYYAISTCHLSYEALPARHTKKLPRRTGIPAVLLGRLAADQSVRGQGLGAALLMDALRRVQQLADQVGIRVVVVDAIDEKAGEFYRHHGFEPLEDDPLRLFIAVDTVRALGLPPLEG